MPDATDFRYELDSHNCIVQVNDAWCSFGKDNGWDTHSGKGIVGHELAQFVAGWDVMNLYDAVFDHVRTSRMAAVIPFRCDSPTTRRYMELEITPQPEGHLGLVGRLIRSVDHPYIPLLDLKKKRNGQWLHICSICRRIRLADGTWREIEDDTTDPYIVPATGLPALTHGVCEDCVRMMQGKARPDAQ